MCALLTGWWVTDHALVIYQLPRPGPALPKGTNYLTVGWKQVVECFFDLKLGPFTSSSDLDSSQDLQIPAIYLCVSVFVFSLVRCKYILFQL